LLVWPCQTPAQPVPAVDVATITIRVPSEAKVTIAGEATTTKGTNRTFVTPSLNSGKSYSYVVVAVWVENSKDKRVERRVHFKGGDSIDVDLTVEKTKAQEKKAEENKKPNDEPKDDHSGFEKLRMPKREGEKKTSAAKKRAFEFTYAATVMPYAGAASSRLAACAEVEQCPDHQIDRPRPSQGE